MVWPFAGMYGEHWEIGDENEVPVDEFASGAALTFAGGSQGVHRCVTEEGGGGKPFRVR